MVAQSRVLLTEVVRREAKPLVVEINDYDPLLKMIGDARTSDWDVGEVPETFPTGSEKGDYNANKTDSKKRMAGVPRSFQPAT